MTSSRWSQGPKRSGITEPWELPPGEEECLLDGVLGPLRVAQDPIRDRVAQVAVEVDQLREGDVVALACQFDQPRPHERYSSGARSGASPLQMVAPDERFTWPALPAGTGPRGPRARDDRGIPSRGSAPTRCRPWIVPVSVAPGWQSRPLVLIGGLLAPAAVAAATDSDHDRLPNTWEVARSLTNPYRADTNRDGRPDGSEDPDRDGLVNLHEYLAGMNPRRADTDRDGLVDGREDTDRDGLRTAFEFQAGDLAATGRQRRRRDPGRQREPGPRRPVESRMSSGSARSRPWPTRTATINRCCAMQSASTGQAIHVHVPLCWVSWLR